MLYVFPNNSTLSFKAYYCNPYNASNLTCTSTAKMRFTTDVTGALLNPLTSSK